MFEPGRCHNWRFNWPMVTQIHIKHVHSSVSYQWVIYQKYDWRGYGTLVCYFLHNLLQMELGLNSRLSPVHL